jgi:hypothetical protein
MAEWKKVIVSGSTANLANVQVDGLTANQVVIGGGTAGNLTTTAINGTGNIVATTGASGLSHSGSFSGSFFGDGSGLSGVSANFPIVAKTDLASTDQFFINDGANKYVTYGNLLTDLAGTNLVVESTDSLTLASQISVTGITASFQGNLTGTASYATQALSASFATTASLATSVQVFKTSTPGFYPVTFVSSSANGLLYQYQFTDFYYDPGTSTLNVSNITSNLLLGTASYATQALSASYANNVGSLSSNITNNTNNYILTATGGGTINGEGNLQFDGTTLTVTGNEVITGNLTVQGTASFQNTTNLEVADRFILFASGSNTAGDGGIVVQQDIQNVGELFGYENSINRWGFTSSFNASSPSFTAAAYITTTETSTAVPSAAPLYGGSSNGYGNIHVKTDTGDIYIYA